ncbi:hypothetical protein OF117_10315 [Geodermatophilus sp. YIM 151500]|uniref:Rv0361 family membrane protein n=1 Tax=Geodermatophilus sp. YIM 151500 TaxID=2984531 RepID=UPI0021E49641|nr:hypothetical protein [Geodermatophilus sp. YIM 151500]MCV2489755.1 hypothetical protein [Geodermatophilus sp. YIM 151500]
MSTGPYLYDDDPAPLHTGTPRQRPWLLVGLLVGTVVVAVAMVVTLPLFRGSPGEQARQSVTVFLAALAADDTETAYGLLCEAERDRIDEASVAEEYLGDGPGRVVSSADEGAVQAVRVEWGDGASSEFTVVNEDGARVCGTAPAG